MRAGMFGTARQSRMVADWLREYIMAKWNDKPRKYSNNACFGSFLITRLLEKMSSYCN